MDRGHVPPKWDIQPGVSSRSHDDERAAKRVEPGNMEYPTYNTYTLRELERRKKLAQVYGESLLSALQTSQPPPSSTTNPNLMVPSIRFPPPTVQIPPPSTRSPSSAVDESSERTNPFPTDFGRSIVEPPQQEALKPKVLSSSIPAVPVQDIGSSTSISPVTNLTAETVCQQMMLSRINALTMNNPSLQAQLLLGQNNSANNLLFSGNMKSSIPDGSRLSKYPAPNKDSFVFDQKAGYKFDSTTGLHYDANSGLFINLSLKTFLRWDPILSTYLRIDSANAGLAPRLGAISRDFDQGISQRSPLQHMNIQPTGISVFPAEVIQSQVNSVPSNAVNPSSTVPLVQDSFMDEIWKRMRALAQEAIVDSLSSQNSREAVGMKNKKKPEKRPYAGYSDGQRRVKRKRSSSSRSQSASPERRKKYQDKRCTSRSQSRSQSVDSDERHVGRKWSRSCSNEPRTSTYSRLPGRNRSHSKGLKRGHSRGRSSHSQSPGQNLRQSHSKGARRSYSRGESTHSTSSGRNRRHSPSYRARRSCSRGRRICSKSPGRNQRRSYSRRAHRSQRRERSTHSKSPGRNQRQSYNRVTRRSRSRGRRRNSHGKRSQSRGRRSTSRARRSRSGRYKISVSRSPSCSWRARSPSRGEKRNSRSCSRNRSRSRSERRKARSRRRSPNQGARGSRTSKNTHYQSHGRSSEYVGFWNQNICNDERELKRKSGSSSPPNKMNYSYTDDHRTDKAITEDVPLGKENKKKNICMIQESSNLEPILSSTKDGDTNQGDSDSLSDFDFLKETLDCDNESVIVDEYEEPLEYDESIFEHKSPESKEDQTLDLGDILGHLFTDGHTSNNIVLVAPVPLRDDLRNAKELKTQIGDPKDVLKIHVFSKATGSPCHYMLIYFKVTEAATHWYNSKNGVVILNGDDGSMMRGYLHFADSGNWTCSNCKFENFLMRTLCYKCFQAKGNQYSPVSVAKEATKYVGITKLKSCFPTTESVLDSLPSLDSFNIQNVQMITEPRNLPMGLCVFTVQNETEGSRLSAFFRQHGRSSIYVMMNEKSIDSITEESTDISCQQNTDSADYKNDLLADERHDEEDPLAPLFTNEMPGNIILVGPFAFSRIPKRSKVELSLTHSFLQTTLEDDGVRYNTISLHIDKNVGAPCCYGLIDFSNSKTAAEWRQKHDNLLNINIIRCEIPTSADSEPSTKVFLHFGENNWECRNCQTSNFFLRSLCHNCFFLRNRKEPGPIRESATTSRWVATSKLTGCFTGNESIVTELTNLMKDLKLLKFFVLRDPEISVFPLGCVFETKSWGESLRLLEFLHRTGRSSKFVKINESFVKFTSTDSKMITNNITHQTATESGESTTSVVNNSDLTKTLPEVSVLRAEPAEPLSAETGTLNFSDAYIGELEPDVDCRKYLLWWSQDSVRYYDILNYLFVHNPLTRVLTSQTLFIGPLPSNDVCHTEAGSSVFQKILSDKLEQDNLPFSAISIHSGPFCGAPCSFGLVSFDKAQDAEAWHHKYKAGLILPRPQLHKKTPKPLSIVNQLFKTFVFFCKPNWQCRSCTKSNFGLRENCFACHVDQISGLPVITFSNTPTSCVCIRKFKSWTVTKELLVDHYPFLKNHSDMFTVKILKEKSGIPLGTCVLETNNSSDAQLLFNHLRASEGRKAVRYLILSESVPGEAGNTTKCEDEFKEIFDDDSPSEILYFGPIPGLTISDGEFYKALLTKEGADCEKVECCLPKSFGTPHGYCLVHLNTLESASDFYRKCQGCVKLTHKPSGKCVINPVNAFLHFARNNWTCDCGSNNLFLRSICYACYKEKNAESAPFTISLSATKYLGVRLFHQWYSTTDKALMLPGRLYNQSKIESIRLYNDHKIPRDFFATYIIETVSVEEAQILLDFYKSSRIPRITNFVNLKSLEPSKVILDPSPSAQVTVQQMDDGDIPKSKSASNSVCPLKVPTTLVNKEVLVCPDYETILWTSLFESRLMNPPSSVVMITLCPGDRQLPDEARSQILTSLQEASANYQSILYSFKGDVGSPFSYCLVLFDSVDSAKTWVDKCDCIFQFNVPCPDETTTSLNFQKCYSLKSSSGGGNTHSIKSKLYYSSPNWQCSCGTFNFPLRSVCHNCFKNKDKESDYERIPYPSSFIGIKLTEYRNLYDFNPVTELRKSGHKILKVATCFDPALPRDPCGVVILEAQSLEFGTKLYNFLNDDSCRNGTVENCKRLMTVLAKSSDIMYFKCPKSLEPIWQFCSSQNWKSYFVDELSSVIAVDVDIVGCLKCDIPLENFGGRLKRLRDTMGFIPGFCLIDFPTQQAAKEWYDENNGKLKNPITSALHSLHFTRNLWKCPKCSVPNFPARVLCHRCYWHRMKSFSPVRMSKQVTRWIGITKDSFQKRAIASLTEDCREEDENFHLRNLEIFFDPNVRQDGTCILVFEVSSLNESLQLKQFLEKRSIKCSFFELVHQSQAMTGISEVSTEFDGLQRGDSEETANALKLESFVDMLNSDLSPGRESNSAVNPLDDDCMDDSEPSNFSADMNSVTVQSQGLPSGSVSQSGMSDEHLVDSDPKCTSEEHTKLSIDCHKSKNSSSSPNHDVCAAPNDLCADSACPDAEIIPMAPEAKALNENRTSTIVDSDLHEPSERSQCSDDIKTPKLNLDQTIEHDLGDRNKLHPSRYNDLKDSTLDDVGMAKLTSGSCIDNDSTNPKVISEPSSVYEPSVAEVDRGSEECACPREPSLNLDSPNVVSVPMDTYEPKTMNDHQTSIILDSDLCEPSNEFQNRFDYKTPKLNLELSGEHDPDDGSKLHPSRYDGLNDLSADDVGMANSTTGSFMNIDPQNLKVISELSSESAPSGEDVDQGLEECAGPREPCRNLDSLDVESLPMAASEPQTLQGDQISSESEVDSSGSQVRVSSEASGLNFESQSFECIPLDTSEPKTALEDHPSDTSQEIFSITESEKSTSTTVESDPFILSQASDAEKTSQEDPELTGQLIPEDYDEDSDDLKESSAERTGLVDPTSGEAPH